MGNAFLMNRRRLILAASHDLVPGVYRQIEYLDTDGTKYIATGLLPSNTIGVYMDFMTYCDIATSSSNSFGCLLGSRYASGNNDFQITTWIADGNPNWGGTVRFGPNSDSTTRNPKIQKNVRQQLSIMNRVLTDTTGGTSTFNTYSWTTNARGIYVFGLNNNGTFTQGGLGCRVYRLKFYDGDTIIRDFIPCQRLSDGKNGLYDAVNNVFYPLV